MQFRKANIQFKKFYVVDPSEKTEILLHHPAAYTASPQDIHRWHLENGWSGAGYHVYIRKNGEVYILRPINTTGAHCKDHNRKGIGVCFEGNFSDWNPKLKVDKEMNPVQFTAGVEVLVHLCKDYKLTVDDIYPHSRFANKDCPGKYFPWAGFLEAVKKELVQADDLSKALEVLVQERVINSPDYWLQNAVPGGTVNGKYAAILIKNGAEKLKGRG